MMIESIIAALLANALVMAVLAYLVKTLLGHRLLKDAEEFKSELQQQTTIKVDEYRSALEKERVKLQIRYGGIFEKQAEAILALYQAVVDLEWGVSEAINFGGEIAERRERFREPWAELRRSFQKNRVLLPQEVEAAMDEFLDRIFRGVHGYISVEARNWGRLSDDQFEKLMERQDKAIEILEKDVPELRNKLVDEMRQVIGVVANEL